MARITVLGGTGYAGAAIVQEAARRGHRVVSLSRSEPAAEIDGVTYVQGDVADEEALARVVRGADAVVGAVAARGPLAARYRDTYRTVARLADAADAPLYVVGGFSSLRPAPGADRFVSDLSHAPAEAHDELRAAAALVDEDLPATPESLNWVFVSPPLGFGAHAPAAPTGTYRAGGDVAVDPAGGAIAAADYALGLVDMIESGHHRRAHVNLAH